VYDNKLNSVAFLGKYIGNLDYLLQHSRVDREDVMDRGRWKKLINIG